MKNLKIARRYAKALLIIGKEDDKAESYKEELDRFSDLITREKELEQAIANPLY
ncbi:MAG: F0F1 ATP synthase subunit delta, partial [Deltaproteobacteria bacterium]|nr:F0F1 ATP synthase subunit delta [Deltaproteobacteria bacterium]